MFQNEVNELITKAEKVYARTFKPITVGSPIRGQTAGWAMPSGTEVKFNEEAAKNYPDIFWKTIVHEVAHAIDIQLHGHRKDARGKYIHHDAIFYEICKKLGDPNPTRTHDMQLKPARKFREFKYKCNCAEGIVVKTPTHNKIQNKGFTYQCRECKTNFHSGHFVKEL